MSVFLLFVFFSGVWHESRVRFDIDSAIYASLTGAQNRILMLSERVLCFKTPVIFFSLSLIAIIDKSVMKSKHELTKNGRFFFFFGFNSGASDYHRTPQDTTGHHRTPQDSTRHARTVPVYLKLLTFIIFSMRKSLFFIIKCFI